MIDRQEEIQYKPKDSFIEKHIGLVFPMIALIGSVFAVYINLTNQTTILTEQVAIVNRDISKIERKIDGINDKLNNVEREVILVRDLSTNRYFEIKLEIQKIESSVTKKE